MPCFPSVNPRPIRGCGRLQPRWWFSTTSGLGNPRVLNEIALDLRVLFIGWEASMKTALALAAMLAVPIWAQNYDEGDDPDHGVARISLLSGDVTIQRGDS